MATDEPSQILAEDKQAPSDVGKMATDHLVRVSTTAEGDITTKSRWERSWPVIAAGAGLFSDGYLNNVR
jgi:hypothetical protein